MAIREHGIYKYVYNNEVIYIGKTDAENGFSNRIKCHEKENELFSNSSIYIHLCKDQTETDSLETILINAYKPKLNKAKQYDYKINPPEIEWIPWLLYSNKDKIIKRTDIIACIKNRLNTIQIGKKYYNLPYDFSKVVDDFYGLYPSVEFYSDNIIRIGGTLDFPTKELLLKMKSKIEYNLEHYDELIEDFILDQYEKITKFFKKEGFIIDEED